MKKMSLPEIISSTLLFGLGVFSLWRGLFFAIQQETVLSDSEFYKALHQFMPIWVWGILMAISSSFLIYSSWLIPKRNRLFHCTFLIGGTMCSFMYLLMTSARLIIAIIRITPMPFSTL